MNMSEERNSIDSLKGIAILGIILVHSGCSFEWRWLNWLAYYGARGVQMMFLINGYLIFKSLDNAKEKNITLKRWYVGKVLRIIPLYWLFTLLHLFVFGTGGRYWIGPLSKVSLLNIVCNLLCIHGFYPYYINSINVNWFIADLAIWYLIAPLCHKLFNSLEKMATFILVIVPSVYIFLGWAGNQSFGFSEDVWYNYVNIFCFLQEFPVILLGGMIYYLKKSGVINRIHFRISYACLFFALAGLGLLYTGSSKFYLFSDMFTWAVCFAILLIVQLCHPLPVLNNRLLSVFGKYSYGIYLCHLFIIYGVNSLLAERLESIGQIGQVGKYLLLCMFSLLVSFCVEKAYQFIRRKSGALIGVRVPADSN